MTHYQHIHDSVYFSENRIGYKLQKIQKLNITPSGFHFFPSFFKEKYKLEASPLSLFTVLSENADVTIVTRTSYLQPYQEEAEQPD